jgi:P4 family phage/plasmid primase-like protien
MATSNRYQNLNEFLKAHKIQKSDGSDKPVTHTRIGSTKLGVYGGSYHIPDSSKPEFYRHYHSLVISRKKPEYLTEKQLDDTGPIAVDMDFRYDPEIQTRQHTKDHIVDILERYMANIQTMLNIDGEQPIDVFVFEKPNVNTTNKEYTKDGIHMIIGVQMDRTLQIMLREKILEDIGNVWQDIPITNTWEDVLDDGISKGHTNWQMYGSKKPENQSYRLKYHLEYCYDDDDKDFECIDKPVKEKKDIALFEKMSIQYTKHPKFGVSTRISKEYNERKGKAQTKTRKTPYVRKGLVKYTSAGDASDIESIKDEKTLDRAIERMREMCTDFDHIDDYHLSEIHDYTMILGKKYWGPGSYDNWIRLGMALRNSDIQGRLLVTWIKVSAQSEEFNYDNIPDMIERWNKMAFNPEDGLTERSIIWWAQNENKKKWDEVYNNTIDHYIQNTFKGQTEFDLATVLHQMYKNRYVCSSIKNNTWWEFRSNRWIETDSGNSLRKNISTKMYKLYFIKSSEYLKVLQDIDKDDEKYKTHSDIVNKLSIISEKLKTTTSKNNIMREAKEIFYDKDFINKLDSKTHLLSFANGVVDFNEKRFRKGHPEDYISKSTNMDYRPLKKDRDAKIIQEVDDFMTQLFPIAELNKYMWDHLASCLIGTNQNQTFNIYTGSGRNGKSKLVELMSLILGEYKATVPITLITQKRNSIGGTSSEIVQLMGTRYAVMQEPSKGDRINEGIMKEITGGDPIQGRALFKDMVTFIPQFKLVVCTNTMFDIKSNWRRIRVCDFKSKFTENPVKDDPDEPYQFEVDKKIETKFEQWKYVFMAKLVELAYENQGNVKDCDIVMGKSMDYREGQDYLSEFLKEKIQKKDGKKIKKTELYETFKQWYIIQYGGRPPKGKEIYDMMDKRYGKYRNGWFNVSIIYDDDDEDDDDMGYDEEDKDSLDGSGEGYKQ